MANGNNILRPLPVLLAIIMLLGLAVTLSVAFNLPFANDHVSFAIYFDDIVNNDNYLLANWIMPKNNLLFTDFPVHFLLGIGLGMGETSLRLGAFVILLATAALISLTLLRTYGPMAALAASAVVLTVPLELSRYLLSPSFHIGTIMFSFLCLLILQAIADRSGDSRVRSSKFYLLLAALFATTTLGVFSDYLLIFIFAVPAVAAILALRAFYGTPLMHWRNEAMVIMSMLLAVALGVLATNFSYLIGPDLVFASHNRMIPLDAASIKSKLLLSVSDLAGLFGMDFAGQQKTPYSLAIRAINVALFLSALWQAQHLIRKEQDAKRRLLVLSTAGAGALLFAAYFVRQVAHPYYLTYLACVYGVFLSLFMTSAPGKPWRAVRVAVLVLFVVSASYNAVEALRFRAVQPHASLAERLRAEDLSYGYTHMQSANILTFLTGNEVKARPVRFDRILMEPDIFNTNMTWYDYKIHDGPTFLLVMDGDEDRGFGYMNPTLLRRMFGMPSRSLRHGNASIYVWNYNIIQHYWINKALKETR